MKKVIYLLSVVGLCFSQSVDDLYNQAQSLEIEGKYKEAMLLYKKAFNVRQKRSILKDDKKAYDKIKHSFYKRYVSKTQDKETDKNIEEILTGKFGIYSYKPNYLMFGSYDTEEYEDNRSQFETVFQISAKKPIFYDLFGLDEIINVAYTQKSFWQTSRDSSPFRETNYAPEVFVEFPYKNATENLKAYRVSLIHESNGRNEEYSRSWNRVYLEGIFQFSNLFVMPKVWYRIPEKDDDNPDIHRYYGYGELRLMYPYKNQNFDLTLRNNLHLDSTNKGSAQLNWTFPLPQFKHFPKSYGFLQIFSGYGNSLIDYNHETHKIGLGIAISR